MLPFGLGDMAPSDDRVRRLHLALTETFILRHRTLDAANHQLFDFQIFRRLNLRSRSGDERFSSFIVNHQEYDASIGSSISALTLVWSPPPHTCETVSHLTPQSHFLIWGPVAAAALPIKDSCVCDD